MVSDVHRRLVARTTAQQCAFFCNESDSSPFSELWGLVRTYSKRLDPNATSLPVHEVGAFDLVSRNAMLQGLLGNERW